MSEVHRFSVVKMLSEAGNKISYDPHGPEIVMAKDYDALAAEAQALREEVERGNRITVAMALDISAVGEALGIPGEEQEGGTGEFIDLIRELQKEVEALRARVVVVPERDTGGSYYEEGWNACLDELARINGMTVSEGLLRRIVTPALTSSDAHDRIGALEELRALLSEDKENGDHAA
ncbi:TPA: hypothetical protein L4S95_004795 [Pseudomonas aeruginosa]|uniref:hypothetical protein n=1 Tax=Pseudomonas aeruginosa TaxID=287 RepID=UPI000E30D63B|nr:hypothetical protein [Pseudomonas aeruginosa]NPZ53794.1 hypothetical protein [Pseudomonas aeruginosa]WAJ86467.1 hypothetical protein PAC13_08395 [Pseudomonas aeruginosa]HBO1538482.1 hypothetical protein [Pseudomonas aeruginosa]HBO1577990.1 hypothetical protein [Pseudomonas aeruginosa]HBO3753247.1 hypothetical protein [Pseudomonas aeruginosa]